MSASEELEKLGPLSKANPDLMKAFGAFNEAVMGAGALDVKTKELIAVAVALTTQCKHCLVIHTASARKAGATDAELAEVTYVAAALRAGGAVTHSANNVITG